MIIIILLIVAIISAKIYYSINKSKIIGKKGEYKVARILNSLGKNYRVFNDVYVKNRYGTSQIDHLVVNVDDSYNVIYTNEIRSKIFEYEDEILTDEQQEDYILALQSFLGKGKVYKKTHAASVAQKKERSRNLIKLGVCPHCGGQLVKRSGKYGSFYGCSNYPKCKFTFK